MMKRQQKKQRHYKFPWVRLIITVAVIILIIVAILLNIQGATILAVLGVVLALFQWLFPLSTEKDDSSAIPPSTSPITEPVKHISQTAPSPLLSTSSVISVATEKPSIVPTSSGPQQKQPVVSDTTQSQSGILQGYPDEVFLFNVVLTRSEEFYGRIRDRKTLVSRTFKGASTSIVGPRRIGKTWLVSYLQLVASTELGPRFRIGYIDATLSSCTTIAGFIASVLEELGVHAFIQDATDLSLIALEKVVRDFKARNQMPVLCIDEFEGFGNRQSFDLDFFNGLRALTQYGLVLVVTSKRPLVDIIGDYGKTSGFFNIFEQIKLKPFTREEAEAFVEAKGSQAKFTEQEKAYVLKYGQDQDKSWPPLRLQLVGKSLLEDKILALEEDKNFYRPADPKYWQDFEGLLNEKYRGVIR